MKTFRVRIDGQEFEVEVEELDFTETTSDNNGAIDAETQPVSVSRQSAASKRDSKQKNDEITAPMSGKILEIKVEVGQRVKKGAQLIVLEAMKMENMITSSRSGVVKEIHVSNGDNVETGEVLLTLEQVK